MKKNIVIITLSIVVVFLFTLSYIKAYEADKNAAEAMEQAMKVMNQQKIAEAQAAEALRAMSELENLRVLLAECKGEQ